MEHFVKSTTQTPGRMWSAQVICAFSPLKPTDVFKRWHGLLFPQPFARMPALLLLLDFRSLPFYRALCLKPKDQQ